MLARKIMVAVATAAGFVLSAFAPAGEHECEGKGSSGKLEVIKQLTGDWVKVGEDGKPTDEVVSSYRVTAGGSAVIETLFAGTDHEMVTVYYEDGEDLVLTHYCVLGNQPRMRARPTSDANKIVFACIGGTNMESEDDDHMHEARLTILGKDRIKVEWLKFSGGKNDYTAAFELVRKGSRGA